MLIWRAYEEMPAGKNVGDTVLVYIEAETSEEIHTDTDLGGKPS